MERINYEDEDGKEEENCERREHVLKSNRGGGACPQEPELPAPSPKLPSLLPKAPLRHKEPEEFSVELREGQLPQSDYEMEKDKHVGRLAKRKFNDGVVREGVITGTDVDGRNGDEMWRIEHEDGDQEDANHLELMESLVPEPREGENPGSSNGDNLEKEREDEIEGETPMAGFAGGTKGVNGGCLTSTNQTSSPKSPTPTPPPPSYNATGTENFMEACRRIGSPNADHFKLCHGSLETKIKQEFERPFLKGKRKQNKLKGGTEFPSPNSLEECRNRKEQHCEENEMPSACWSDAESNRGHRKRCSE
jgi:hypothetical protein